MRIRDVQIRYEDHAYRTPIKFGGVALDKVTLLNVSITVEGPGGYRATGIGSMPLGNVWAWPSKGMTYDQTLAGMKVVAATLVVLYRKEPVSGHPVEIGTEMEGKVLTAVGMARAALKSPEAIPHLAALVVNSPFDAALHDAYGKLHGRSVYQLYGPQFLRPDLGRLLTPDFRGETLDRYVSPTPKATMPLYHLVGALDPLTAGDVTAPVGDGLPETLADWIRRDGLTHLKVKLNGDDLGWDVDRVVRVNAVAEETAADRAWHYSLDFNEKCKDVQYLLDFLGQLKERSPAAFGRVQYVEQPTARDLRANLQNRMHAAAKIVPVVIDESLVGVESLFLARDMGYTGVAFKACKGQTQTLLLAALAQKLGLFRCVQDLTCPGASLIHSAGIAAHIPGVTAIESNGRQYCPAANAGWDERFPGVFTVRDGVMNTGLLTGPGLGT